VSGPPNQGPDVRRKEMELARAILEYLAEHPDAQDTAEGIASFWVMRQEVKEEVEGVLRVLNELTESGQLERVQRGDRVLYRLKKESRP
jgi:Fe2+ or Zn2+ uptake regulation protein